MTRLTMYCAVQKVSLFMVLVFGGELVGAGNSAVACTYETTVFTEM